jgi:guanine deaminase
MNQYMRMALAEALGGMRAAEGGPFGAVIVAPGGRVVARAHNRVIASKDPTAHAEIEAIREASAALGRFDLSDCEIYASSEPCPMCLAAILWARIPRVYYGCTHEEAEAAGFSDAAIAEVLKGKPRPGREGGAGRGRTGGALEMTRVDGAECSIALKEWQAKADRIQY